MRGRGNQLQSSVLETLKTCSDLVGSTLGPGGRSVIIEHQDPAMPPVITKDGVTVFRSLGFTDPTKQVLMEAARDSSIRTASEAGDGTTTATILAEAFTRNIMEFCEKNPHESPQRVARFVQSEYQSSMVPMIEALKLKPDLYSETGKAQLRAVAKISANGDEPLATAVMKAFDVIGDAGNVTISEANGPSGYHVQLIEGYPVGIGYEDACGPFYQKFVNDVGTQQTVLERPSFILHHGRISDFNAIFPALAQIANLVSEGTQIDGKKLTHNVVLVATGFSEVVLAHLAAGFVQEGTLNIFPLLVPPSPIKTGQYDFLCDLAALTGAAIFDPLELPLQNFVPEHIGVGPRLFEAGRFRSNVIGNRDSLLVLERVDQITKQLSGEATSDLEKTLLRERVAKLTSGIAKIVVQGSSYGEIKERRDRVEDAICAVREAIKHGALPGGGVTLAVLSKHYTQVDSPIAQEIIAPSLLEPVKRLYSNAGYLTAEIDGFIAGLSKDQSFDVMLGRSVDPAQSGLLDSLPAVREALKNAISIAGLLGTCGGTVVFPRDGDLERSEASDTAEWLRNASVNEANERG